MKTSNLFQKGLFYRTSNFFSFLPPFSVRANNDYKAAKQEKQKSTFGIKSELKYSLLLYNRRGALRSKQMNGFTI